MIKLITFFALTFAVKAAIFTCPNAPITNTPIDGTIPAGATAGAQVTANCVITFQVPNGYAVQLVITNTGVNGTDSVTLVDSSNTSYQTQPEVRLKEYWFPSGTNTMKLVSTGTLYFYVSYKYWPLNTFTQNTRSTGTYLYAGLTQNMFYTFTSKAGDKVTITVGKPTPTTVDQVAGAIFVYDGADITTSRMIGRLNDLAANNKNRFTSTGSSISFVLLNAPSTVKSVSYIVGNDASAVANFDKYSVITTSTGRRSVGTLIDISDSGSATTFLCTDCDTLYLNKLEFVNSFIQGQVQLQGLTPTQKLEKLVTYNQPTFQRTQIPQIIAANMFTFYLKMATVNIDVSTDIRPFEAPYDKRTGVILSPSLWDPSNSGYLDYTITNSSQTYTYNFEFTKTANIDLSKLSIQIGYNGQKGTNYQANANGKVSQVGNYARISYSDKKMGADARIAYSMTAYSSATGYSTLLAFICAMFFYISQ